MSLFIECDFCVGPGNFKSIFFLQGDIEKAKNRSKSHVITLSKQRHVRKEQDKSSISFIFKFRTDWGVCDLMVPELELMA